MKTKTIGRAETTAAVGLPPAHPRATDRQRLDQALDRLRQGSRTFAKLTLEQRIELACSMQAGYLRVAQRSVLAACRAKGIVPGTPGEGEEWSLGPWCVVRHLRLIREALTSLRRTGNTPIGGVGHTHGGRLSIGVFPGNAIDSMLFKGVRADVHLQPGIGEGQMHESRGAFYKRPDHDGRVALVLGAGNVNAIVSQDASTKLFNEGKACIVKMNPVNAYLGPFLEEAFAEPIARGFLAVVYGGANEGEYLAHHAAVDEVHLTGSDRTFDTLVWGPPGRERDERRRNGAPLLRKPIAAELGNVSPVLVLPGPYTQKELRHQAADVASALAYNASFDCNAAKVIVTPKGWSGREAFLAALTDCLSSIPARRAYYPGARERWEAVTAGRPTLRTFGQPGEDALPWALVAGVDGEDRDERAFASESFCPVLLETSVGGADPIEFLDSAVAFANEHLWGTLSAELVVHPRSMIDTPIAEAVERAIGRLRYGVVTVNAWSGLAFAFGSPPWGGHPSSTLDDIQSGRGWVHNTSMLEGIEKAVLRHPLVAFPKPAYFTSHRTAHVMMPRLTRLEESASWTKVPGVVAAAMRS